MKIRNLPSRKPKQQKVIANNINIPTNPDTITNNHTKQCALASCLDLNMQKWAYDHYNMTLMYQTFELDVEY